MSDVLCPSCHQPVDNFEFVSADTLIGVEGEPVVDLQLRCPHCQAVLNMFPSITQFEVYP